MEYCAMNAKWIGCASWQVMTNDTFFPCETLKEARRLADEIGGEVHLCVEGAGGVIHTQSID